ncbi:MAG: response regulator [SAR324 cluster bacterium]|nr:response regulator [SAR324 cluster bacterium]
MSNIRELAQLTSDLKVLYVEDDEQLQIETAQLFSNFFHDLTSASNGQKGLELYQDAIFAKKPFDIVISDIHMPVMNGIEMLGHIKRINRDQAAIVVSAHDDSNYLMEIINMGIDQFILKPLSLQNFLGVLQRVYHDLTQYREMLQKMEQEERSLEMMEHGVFRFQTPEDVDNLARVLSQVCPDPLRTMQGLLELLTNAVEHGNLGLSYDEKTVLVENMELEEEIENRLQQEKNLKKYGILKFYKSDSQIRLHIQDQGQGFDFKKYLSFDKNRIFDNHGRGIAMSKTQFFDDVHYIGCGNEVEALVKLGEKNLN